MPHAEQTHDAFAAAFRDGLATGALPPGITARDPDEAPRWFAVYRNNVVHSLGRALAARFPVVERLVGGHFFAAMAAEFIARHPPASPVLLEWGEAMPGFLEAFPPVAALQYLPDVARLELARGAAFDAADAAPVSAGTLTAAAAAGGDLRIALHPSLRLVPSRWPVVALWQANQPGAAGYRIEGGGETALVARRPDLSILTQAVLPEIASVIRALCDDGRVLRAAERADADPAPALALLIGAGLVIDAQPGDTP